MILTVDEVKTHLRIEEDMDDEDECIAGLIEQAQEMAESYCRVSFEPLEAETDEEGNVTKAGYEPPKAARLACKLMVSHLYEYRDGNDHVAYTTTMEAFKNLLYPHRDPELMF